MEVNPADVAAQTVKKYYAPTLAPERMPQGLEPDVVTIKLRQRKWLPSLKRLPKKRLTPGLHVHSTHVMAMKRHLCLYGIHRG